MQSGKSSTTAADGNTRTSQPAREYRAHISLALPTSEAARQVRDVLSVDGELGDKIVKSFSVVRASDVAAKTSTTSEASAPSDADGGKETGVRANDDCDGDDEPRVLRIIFEATDAKMLRVAVSSMYDSINVTLKCFQEFGAA